LQGRFHVRVRYPGNEKIAPIPVPLFLATGTTEIIDDTAEADVLFIPVIPASKTTQNNPIISASLLDDNDTAPRENQ
jgi:hypothetical protein